MQEKSTTALPDIEKTVLLNAPLATVWNAVATSQGLTGWWMENSFEAREGFEFVVHAGAFGDSPCKVSDLDPPYRLSFFWGKDWKLTFLLHGKDGATELTLIHSGWDAQKVTEFGQSHTVIRQVMDGGWGDLDKLRSYVEGSTISS